MLPLMFPYVLAISSCITLQTHHPVVCSMNQKQVNCCTPPATIHRMDKELILQGNVGACHIFATSEVFYQKTNLKLSKARFFLDHMLNQERLGQDAQRALYDKHLEWIKHQKNIRAVSCRFNPLEGGYFDQDMRLLQQVGGVLVPDNADWLIIEVIMASIRKEVQEQNREPVTIDENSARQRLGDAGLRHMIEIALSDINRGKQTANDRLLVQAAAQQLIPKKVELKEDSLYHKTTQLIRTLANHGALYLNVHQPSLSFLKSKKKALGTYPPSGGHAVALLGYDVSTKLFFIKDSMDGWIWQLDASGVAAVTYSAWYLQNK